MKKIKLLAPILGMTAIAGTVVPMVSCTYEINPEELTFSFKNMNEATDDKVEFVISDSKVLDNKDLLIHITWQTKEGDEQVYYPDYTVVQVDYATIDQKSEWCPNGFTIVDYDEDGKGYSISIPYVHLRPKAKIEIDIALEVFQGQVKDAVALNKFDANFIKYDSTWYNCLHTDTENLIDSLPRNYIAFEIDTEQWGTANFNDKGDIYFMVGFWSGTSVNSTLILDKNNLSKLYMGQYALESSYNSWHGYLTIKAPSAGWKAAATSSSKITGLYKFNNQWDDMVLAVGQKAI